MYCTYTVWGAQVMTEDRVMATVAVKSIDKGCEQVPIYDDKDRKILPTVDSIHEYIINGGYETTAHQLSCRVQSTV